MWLRTWEAVVTATLTSRAVVSGSASNVTLDAPSGAVRTWGAWPRPVAITVMRAA